MTFSVIKPDEAPRLSIEARDCVRFAPTPATPIAPRVLASMVVRGEGLDAAVREAQLLGARFYRLLDQPLDTPSLRRR